MAYEKNTQLFPLKLYDLIYYIMISFTNKLDSKNKIVELNMISVM